MTHLIRFYDAEEMRDRLTLKFPQLWCLIAEAYEAGAFDYQVPEPTIEPMPAFAIALYAAPSRRPYEFGILIDSRSCDLSI